MELNILIIIIVLKNFYNNIFKKYYLLTMYNMYNMFLTIGNRKFNLIILIVCVFIFWIMFGHLLCSCCRYPIYETFTDMAKETTTQIKKKIVDSSNKIPPKVDVSNKTNAKEGYTGLGGFRMNLGNGMNNGETFSKFPEMPINASNWDQPNLTKGSSGLSKVNSYKNTQIPLDDTMYFFKDTQFKPECCNPGSTFSLSSGCACLNENSAKYLWSRGGNNVPYSEY